MEEAFLRNKILRLLESRSKHLIKKFHKECKKYSKKFFKPTNGKPYKSLLTFSIFDLPAKAKIKEQPSLMLEAIRLILVKVENVLHEMDQKDDFVHKMLKHIGNLIGLKHPMGPGNLHKIIIDPSKLKWTPVEKNLSNLETTTCDYFKKTSWPKMKNEDGDVPTQKEIKVIVARVITLTFLAQLSQLMWDLHHVVGDILLLEP